MLLGRAERGEGEYDLVGAALPRRVFAATPHCQSLSSFSIVHKSSPHLISSSQAGKVLRLLQLFNSYYQRLEKLTLSLPVSPWFMARVSHGKLTALTWAQ
jgi:hypothetical protein